MFEYYFCECFGVLFQELIDKVGFSGDYSCMLLLVESGVYVIGVFNYQVWDQVLVDGEIDIDKVWVIWEIFVYLDYYWIVCGDLDECFGDGFSEWVIEVLLVIDDLELFEVFLCSVFVFVDNDDYQVIEDIVESIGLLD